jgi:membrane protease YdiL (CAAX protease family)
MGTDHQEGPMAGDITHPLDPNPYLSSPANTFAPPLPSPPAPSRPRIWPVFVSFVVAFIAMIGVQIVAAVGLVFWYLANGGSPARMAQELPKLITQAGPFMLLTGSSQLAMLGTVLAFAAFSPVPLTERLGWKWPKIPLWHWTVHVLGGVIPFTIGILCAYGMVAFFTPDPTIASLYEQMTPVMAVPFIFFIAVAPGFNEETLFRGYMQRRLLQRWHPLAAILVVSTLFAIVHITPHAMALAFPCGLWLGILAWRTNSTWPGIISHALFNGGWNVYVIGTTLQYLPDPLPLWFQILFFGTALICFGVSAVLLARTKPGNVVAISEPTSQT